MTPTIFERSPPARAARRALLRPLLRADCMRLARVSAYPQSPGLPMAIVVDVHYVPEATMRLVACLTMCLTLILANAAQTGAQAPSDSQAYCVNRIRVNSAKVAINSDRAIAEELTGAWLPCQESSASHRPA